MFFRKNSEEVVLNVDSYSLVIRIKVNGKFVYKMQCVIKEDTILIGDIVPEDGKIGRYENRGYGSRMMNKLIEYAKENGIKEITGNLSTVDLNHKDRLEHFYQKFGFEIIVYDKTDEDYYGCIRKIL